MEELNLLGKYRSGSVYYLFNKVNTKGGERLLDQYFSQPLDNAAAINERSSIFQYFQQLGMAFPFDAAQLGVMQEYLDTGTAHSSMWAVMDIVKQQVLARLVHDERYRKLVRGIQATIMVLKQCYSVLEALAPQAGPYTQRVATLRQVLCNPELKPVLDTDIYQALPLKDLARYDYLLKGKLHKQLETVLAFIYELDVNITVGQVARANGFSYALALAPEHNLLAITKLRHPAIENAVGNDITLQGKNNVLFLTGANMAGKSTLMKSTGIALYLAHIGFPVAAESMEFSVRNGLFSSINVADNIHLGYSHFYGEVMRVKDAAQAVATGKHLLVMFDELFKGTNVKDAYDGTLAVISAFAAYTDCLFIFSTHIIEVGEALKEQEGIQFAFLPTVMEGVRPRYTYELRQGITEDRQGMMIVRNEGILELIGE